MTDIRREYEVTIVGCGPVGAIAAAWLGHYGISTLLIDKAQHIWDIPRAIALDHEIMRVFQNLGLVHEIEPFTAPFPASEHFGVEGQLIRRIDAVPPPFPLGYTPTLVFTQPEVERVLREHVSTLPTVDVALGVELLSFTQSATCVAAQLKGKGGEPCSVQSSYLIGCDGASSFVRQQINIHLEDLEFDEPWMVVDVVVDEDRIAKLPLTAAQYCNPERPTTYIVGPKNHRRWEIMLLPEEDPREMEQEQNVWRLLSQWLSPSDGRLWRASSYRFHALLADSWRHGRVLLAGDAAHQQPPFIGQGMCQGIRDVTNLAWKLREVLHQGASESLLDTYTEERKLHVRMLTSRIKEIGRHICERDPERARMRDEELLRKGGGSAPVITRQEIVPPLAAGLLTQLPDPGRGILFPQPWLELDGSDVRLDDRVGEGWHVFVDGNKVDQSPEAFDRIPATLIGGEGLTEHDGVARKWFEAHDCVAALVRPDHYVYSTAKTLKKISDDVAELERAKEKSDLTASQPTLEAHVDGRI